MSIKSTWHVRAAAMAAFSAATAFGGMNVARAGDAPQVTRAAASYTPLAASPLAATVLYTPATSARPVNRPAALLSAARVKAEEMPDLRWDHVDGSARWTRAAMRALDSHGRRLIETVPNDIADWCPAYPQADTWERKAFWAGLLSTLAKHESTWRPSAVGGGGLWYGLVQILPATARGYGCEAKSGAALKDGAANMSCAVRILNLTVPRDGVVARGMRGVAADWGPFHSRRKREDMRAWIRTQSFCSGLHASMRPVARPDWLAAPAGEAHEVPLFVSWELDKSFVSPVPLRVALDV